MTVAQKIQIVTIPASSGALAAVTSPVPLGETVKLGVVFPSLTSCQVFLQVAADPASASFARAVVNSGQISYAVAAGLAGIEVGDIVRGFPYCRIELSVGQAAVRSLSVIQRVT
jgi:hypothetical protein